VIVDGLAGRSARAGGIGRRIELRQDRRRRGIELAARDDVALKWLPRERVVDDPVDLGKIAVPHFFRRNGREKRLPLIDAIPLIVAEEERLALDNRSAERGAELMLAEGGLGPPRPVVEEIVRVEGIVSEELERVAVEPVGAGLG